MGRDGKHRRIPKHDVRDNDEIDTWRSSTEVQRALRALCGQWQDQKGSTYTLTLTGDHTLQVRTRRPSGHIILTPGLIRIDWCGEQGRIVWGKSGARNLYTIAAQDKQTVTWGSEGSALFQWERVSSNNTENVPFDGKKVSAGAGTGSERPPHSDTNEWEASANVASEKRQELRRQIKEERKRQEEEALNCTAVALKQLLGIGNKSYRGQQSYANKGAFKKTGHSRGRREEEKREDSRATGGRAGGQGGQTGAQAGGQTGSQAGGEAGGQVGKQLLETLKQGEQAAPTLRKPLLLSAPPERKNEFDDGLCEDDV